MNKLEITSRMSTETAKALINGKEVLFQYQYTVDAPVVTVVNFQYQNSKTGNTMNGNITAGGHINLNGMLSPEDFALFPETLEIGLGILESSKPKENPTLSVDNVQKE